MTSLRPANGEREQAFVPRVPDTIGNEEFIAVVVLDGEEYGLRAISDVRTSYKAAELDGRMRARNVGRGASFVVLRREVGPWMECRS